MQGTACVAEVKRQGRGDNLRANERRQIHTVPIRSAKGQKRLETRCAWRGVNFDENERNATILHRRLNYMEIREEGEWRKR